MGDIYPRLGSGRFISTIFASDHMPQFLKVSHDNRILAGPGGGDSPNLPQSSLGILKVPQLPLPFDTPLLRTL